MAVLYERGEESYAASNTADLILERNEGQIEQLIAVYFDSLFGILKLVYSESL